MPQAGVKQHNADAPSRHSTDYIDKTDLNDVWPVLTIVTAEKV